MTRRALLIATASAAAAQQVPDVAFDPPIGQPLFAAGAGPVIAIDEAHHNFHTAAGRYRTFAGLLKKAGFQVKPAQGICDVFVIANALHESNAASWALPNPPAFSSAEVASIEEWVASGGALLLIADHQPFPGAISTLAAAFGVTFHNGYAMEPPHGGWLRFRKSEGGLREHAVTRGVDAVVTFQGSAFRAPAAEPVLVFGENAVSYVTETPGKGGGARIATVPVGGWLQGAVLAHGRGRVAVFGEAAMFSAQLAGPDRRPMGMNHPDAAQNPQFRLNVLRWLSSGPRVGRAPLPSSR